MTEEQGIRLETARSEGLPGWKRALDLLALLIFGPGLVAIGVGVAIIVRLGSKGPVFFRQRRVGYRGEQFVLLKFRTMHLNAETESHRRHLENLIGDTNAPMKKLDDSEDPRVIPLGAILRSTGLDELPQFINVLRGEMSIVGPRPCIPYEYERYEPRHRKRLDAVPGLTGLWQVSGKNKTTFEEMVQLDVRYAREKTPWLDIRIMLRTVPALVEQVRENRAARQRKSTSGSETFGNSVQSTQL